jgi:Protein of unknown function (DUF995)
MSVLNPDTGWGSKAATGMKRMFSIYKLIAIGALAGLLSGCSGMNIFKDSAPEPQALPNDPAEPQVGSLGLSADEIRKTLSGKSWNWSGPSNSGVTLFAEDGTSLIEVKGKGTTKGKWFAKDGELCESVDPAKFIPQGAPMSCRPFSGQGGNYQVGNAQFTLAS